MLGTMARERAAAPAGSRQVSRLKVRDLMTAKVYSVRPTEAVRSVIRLMDEHHVRHVPIVDAEGDLVGLLSHRDLLRSSLIERPDVPGVLERAVHERVRVREVMNPYVETVAPETDIRQAAQIMLENKFGCLPVVNGRRLIGILTESDFVRFLGHGT